MKIQYLVQRRYIEQKLCVLCDLRVFARTLLVIIKVFQSVNYFGEATISFSSGCFASSSLSPAALPLFT